MKCNITRFRCIVIFHWNENCCSVTIYVFIQSWQRGRKTHFILLSFSFSFSLCWIIKSDRHRCYILLISLPISFSLHQIFFSHFSLFLVSISLPLNLLFCYLFQVYYSTIISLLLLWVQEANKNEGLKVSPSSTVVVKVTKNSKSKFYFFHLSISLLLKFSLSLSLSQVFEVHQTWWIESREKCFLFPSLSNTLFYLLSLSLSLPISINNLSRKEGKSVFCFQETFLLIVPELSIAFQINLTCLSFSFNSLSPNSLLSCIHSLSHSILSWFGSIIWIQNTIEDTPVNWICYTTFSVHFQSVFQPKSLPIFSILLTSNCEFKSYLIWNEWRENIGKPSIQISCLNREFSE